MHILTKFIMIKNISLTNCLCCYLGCLCCYVFLGNSTDSNSKENQSHNYIYVYNDFTLSHIDIHKLDLTLTFQESCKVTIVFTEFGGQK